MNPLETYLRDLAKIHSSGAAVPDMAYYVPPANLLDEIGKTLKPRVSCIMSLNNRSPGLPDVGLFTPNQLQKGPEQAARTIFNLIDKFITKELQEDCDKIPHPQ